MKEMGIKIWVLTGDKLETAINIAVSCNLFTNTDNLLICNAGKKDVMKKIEQVTHHVLHVLQSLSCVRATCSIQLAPASAHVIDTL